MANEEPAALFALRLEYVAARRELEAVRDARRAGDARERALADRVQTLYCEIWLLEHGHTEED